MKIKWGFDDGYANRRPDRVIEVPDEDLEDLDEAEQDKIIDEYVQEAFLNSVHSYWRREGEK